MVWLGRIIGGNDVISLEILEALSRGDSVEEILSSENISPIVAEKQEYLTRANTIIAERLEVVDRLAVVRLEDMSVRSNGYRVTALAGDDCDACMVIHGDVGAGFGEEDRYPVSGFVLHQLFPTHRRRDIRPNSVGNKIRSRRRRPCQCMWL